MIYLLAYQQKHSFVIKYEEGGERCVLEYIAACARNKDSPMTWEDVEVLSRSMMDILTRNDKARGRGD